MAFNVGDRVNWRYEPRGGYGFSVPVAAVVVRVGPSRVRVRSARFVAGQWVSVIRSVDPARLSVRSVHVPAVDDVVNLNEGEQ